MHKYANKPCIWRSLQDRARGVEGPAILHELPTVNSKRKSQVAIKKITNINLEAVDADRDGPGPDD